MVSQPKIVTVNDKMQRDYRYAITSPIGRDFDPKQMLALGVFCGRRAEFPASWFAHARLAPLGRDCSLNYFGVDASQPCQCGARTAGFIPTTRAGGSSGTAATIWAAAWWMRTLGRSDAGKQSDGISHRSNGTVFQETRSAARANGRPCSIGPMIVGRFEGRAPLGLPLIARSGARLLG
jgi:hypothetical protein